MSDVAKKSIDWERIEAEYRVAKLSTCEIGRQHDVKESTIRMRAKRHGWERDLTEQVNEKVRIGLVRDAVRDDVRDSTRAQTEREVVEAAAIRSVEIVRSHRKDIRESREMFGHLLDELRATTSARGELAKMIEEATKDDANSKRHDAMMRAISLPSRAGVMRDLSTAHKNMIGLERQAFSITDENKDDDLPRVNIGVKNQDVETELEMVKRELEELKRSKR